MAPSRPPTNRELLALARAWVAHDYPGCPLEYITLRIRFVDHPVRLVNSTREVFLPNAFQKAILAALAGKALMTDALGDAVGDRSRLFKPGSLKELREHGLVEHHKRLGYYRPDVPPPELAGD